MRRSRWAAVAALLVAAGLLAGCAQTVAGTGTPGITGPSGFPGTPGQPSGSGTVPSGPAGSGAVPSGSGSPAVQGSFTCPTISDTEAHLRYPCVTTGMTLSVDTSGEGLPRTMVKQTEPTWVISEGAAQLEGSASAAMLRTSAATVSQQLISVGYGTGETAATVAAASATVAGHQAWVQQSSITIGAAFRAAQKLKVSQERLWVVVVQLTAATQTVWVCSIPNTASSLWPSVPGVISQLTVT